MKTLLVFHNYPLFIEKSISIAPIIDDENQDPNETQKLLEKRVTSVKKSKILKEFIKTSRCGFVSENMLREDPVQAFKTAYENTNTFSYTVFFITIQSLIV